jgi:hypothetical protein
MGDYVTLRNRIIDELANDGALTTAQVNYAIADTIKAYERREWWFNSDLNNRAPVITSFTTVANQEYYSASDWSPLNDAVQIDTMTVTYNGVQIPLKPVAFDEINDVQTGYGISVPRVFAYYDAAIRFYPIPNDAYVITVGYTQRFTALSADSDTNAWTTEAEELIRQGAKRRIALNYFHSVDVAQRCAILEQEALDALLAENRRRQPNTTLRAPLMAPREKFSILTG